MFKQKNQNGFSALEAFLVLVLVGIIGFSGWYVMRARNNANAVLNKAADESSDSVTIHHTTATAPATLAPGTDNNSLNSDLKNVTNSMTNENSDSSSSNAALNDQQNEIQVPTN